MRIGIHGFEIHGSSKIFEDLSRPFETLRRPFLHFSLFSSVFPEVIELNQVKNEFKAHRNTWSNFGTHGDLRESSKTLRDLWRPFLHFSLSSSIFPEVIELTIRLKMGSRSIGIHGQDWNTKSSRIFEDLSRSSETLHSFLFPSIFFVGH